MEVIGFILVILGAILFLSTKILGRKNTGFMEGQEEQDFLMLLRQSLLLIKIMAAVLVLAGFILNVLMLLTKK